jgi:Zn-dependent protease
MFASLKLGRFFGIPLYVHSTFLLLPAWVLLNNQGAGIAAALFSLVVLFTVFACVVLHELGHALMARAFGIGTRDITLYPIGGVARLERMSERPFEEVCIALAGPAVNLVIALLLTPFAIGFALTGLLSEDALTIAGLGHGPLAWIGLFLAVVWFSNGMLLLFNLLPAFPMDGGRVLRAVLSHSLGQLRATEIAAKVGLFMAVLIACSALVVHSPMPVILAVFVFLAGRMELQGLRHREWQRRRASWVQENVPAPTEEAPANPAPFTGFAWDRQNGVWVRWHNGRPVPFYGPTE